MIAQQLYGYLSTNTPISSAVGGRIVPNYVKETVAYPQIVYKCANAKSDECMDGNGNPYTVEVTLLVVSERSYADADAIANTVVSELDGYSGQWGSIKVLGVFLDDMSDDTVVEPNSERVLYYLKEIELSVVFER